MARARVVAVKMARSIWILTILQDGIHRIFSVLPVDVSYDLTLDHS